MRTLEEAVRTRDVIAWRTAWQKREAIRKKKQRLASYEALLKKLDKLCPGLAECFRSTGGEPLWQERIRKLREAWNWALLVLGWSGSLPRRATKRA
jgi:organic radical activating enzyme